MCAVLNTLYLIDIRNRSAHAEKANIFIFNMEGKKPESLSGHISDTRKYDKPNVPEEKAPQEIEKLKQESETSKEKQKQLEQKISSQKQPDNLTISATELKPYLSAVLHIKCFGNNYTSSGSGTLWKWNNSYAVLTNDHVILEDGNDDCVASWPLDEAQDWQRGDFFWIDSKTDLDWNNETDTRVALILNKEKSINNFPVANANYSLYSLRRCPTKLPLGSPVVVIGYPASTQTDTNSPRTLTDGVISGHDQSVQPPQGVLPYTDYFVSNKIDSAASICGSLSAS